jgi:hypothetical protein
VPQFGRAEVLIGKNARASTGKAVMLRETAMSSANGSIGEDGANTCNGRAPPGT